MSVLFEVRMNSVEGRVPVKQSILAQGDSLKETDVMASP